LFRLSGEANDVVAVSQEDAQALTAGIGQGLQIAASATDTKSWIIRIPRTAPRNIVRVIIL